MTFRESYLQVRKIIYIKQGKINIYIYIYIYTQIYT